MNNRRESRQCCCRFYESLYFAEVICTNSLTILLFLKSLNAVKMFYFLFCFLEDKSCVIILITFICALDCYHGVRKSSVKLFLGKFLILLQNMNNFLLLVRCTTRSSESFTLCDSPNLSASFHQLSNELPLIFSFKCCTNEQFL